MKTHFDLSHTIEHGMITYRGLPAPLICDFLSREASRKLYAAFAYKVVERYEVPLAGGLKLPVVRMSKRLIP